MEAAYGQPVRSYPYLQPLDYYYRGENPAFPAGASVSTRTVVPAAAADRATCRLFGLGAQPRSGARSPPSIWRAQPDGIEGKGETFTVAYMGKFRAKEPTESEVTKRSEVWLSAVTSISPICDSTCATAATAASRVSKMCSEAVGGMASQPRRAFSRPRSHTHYFPTPRSSSTLLPIHTQKSIVSLFSCCPSIILVVSARGAGQRPP
eukprot:scaffold33573_cov33-Tisochrysis_lutea.AAC.3